MTNIELEEMILKEEEKLLRKYHLRREEMSESELKALRSDALDRCIRKTHNDFMKFLSTRK